MKLDPHHFVHHARFYLSAAIGVAVWFALFQESRPVRAVVSGDAFFAAYLASMAMFGRRATLESMRSRARFDDEGIGIIVLMTLAAIGFGLWSIFAIVNRSQEPTAWHIALLIANIPLAWLTLHTLAAFHYGHVYYGDADGKGTRRDAGGLIFPGDEMPLMADFVYYAFVVGMTAQVSDVQVTSREMRRLTLVHGVVSFFFNTIILALAVNVAAGLGR